MTPDDRRSPMFSLFERYLQPTAVPEHPEPPAGYCGSSGISRARRRLCSSASSSIEFFVALTDSAVPWFMGRIVTMVTTIPPEHFIAETWPWLVGMALVVLVARPAIGLARYLITNQAMAAPFTGLIRWQSHYHVVRQSWAFFQNDFAGRISNRVMQTGPAVRQTLVAAVTALWYVLVYGITALVMTAAADAWLTIPILAWFAGYVALLWYFVPRMRDRSKISSEARSALVGRIVDSYTNILTVKLFARPRDEDNYVRAAVERHTDLFLTRSGCSPFRHVVERPQCAADRRRGRDRDRLVATRRGRGRRHRDGAAAHAPAYQHVATDRRADRRLVRGNRHRAGGHDHDREAAATHRSADAKPLVVREGKISFEDVQFGYGREYQPA